MRAPATAARATEAPALTTEAPAVVVPPVPVPVVPSEPVPEPPVEPVEPPGAVLEVAWAASDLKLAREREALAAVLIFGSPCQYKKTRQEGVFKKKKKGLTSR